MISITCTNCQAALSIDDAFAGGVCRCQHCGTIQTVPSRKKDGPGGTAAGLGVKTPKTLYQKRVREAGVGTGLDELAEAVTSSGLTGSGLSSRAARPPGSGPTRSNRTALLIGLAAVVIVVLLVIILVMMKGRGSESTAGAGSAGGTSPGGSQAGQPVNGTGPSFAGVKLDYPTVIYLLDRGSSIAEPFGNLKQAAVKSMQTLGGDRRFQVIFWDNGQDAGTFPPLLSFASEAKVADVARQIDDVFAFGATDARPALEKAMNQRPAAIVLVTGKGADLDDSFVQMVKEVRKDANTVIHTFAVGGVGSSTALKTVAQSTGGEFRELSAGQLSTFAQ